MGFCFARISMRFRTVMLKFCRIFGTQFSSFGMLVITDDHGSDKDNFKLIILDISMVITQIQREMRFGEEILH